MRTRLAVLERRAEQAQLEMAHQVQRSVSDGFATMVGSSAAVQKVYPPVTRLPGHIRKRILVTGGAGFLGSNLVDVLMQQGHQVYVLDNLFTGRFQNIAHWSGHPNFMFFQHDVINAFNVEVDQIYHLACPASPPHYQHNPIKTIKISTMGTMNMLGLAKRTGARLMFASTSEIYGDPSVHPQPESYWGNVNTLGPRACYDEGKRVAETMCYSYAREEAVEVRIARIFNTFGPRMHRETRVGGGSVSGTYLPPLCRLVPAAANDGRVVSNFILAALQGKPM